MAYLTLDDLQFLQSRSAAPSVTIYMPTHRTGREVEQDPIRLRNLLRDAARELSEHGLKDRAIEELLAPAQALLEKRPFWQHQSDGLALFLSEADFHHYRLPMSFEERVMVGQRYYLKPLFPAVTGDGRFYILAFSQKDVRLLQGSRDNVSEVNLTGVADALAETLQLEDYQNQVQYHTGTPNRDGRREAIYHGAGDTQVDTKQRIRQFFQRIDKELVPFLRHQTAPLVLAGVDYLHAIYSDVNSYPHLADDGVMGNPDDLSAEEMHRKAWQVVAPLFQAAVDQARETVAKQAGSNSKSFTSTLGEIVPAAHNGRIHTLFVAGDEQRWGTFDPETQKVDEHEASRADSDDLLDLAAVRALATGAQVYVVPRAEMPVDAAAAALLRY